MKRHERILGGQIGCAIFIIVFNVTIGAWSVGQILSWMGKDIPLLGDVLIGLVVGQVTVPIAIVGWVLKACGVF